MAFLSPLVNLVIATSGSFWHLPRRLFSFPSFYLFFVQTELLFRLFNEVLS